MNQLWAGLLVGAGILIMTCSGLCSAGFILFALQSALQGHERLSGLVMLPIYPLLFGGPPMLFGWALYRHGRRMQAQQRDGD